MIRFAFLLCLSTLINYLDRQTLATLAHSASVHSRKELSRQAEKFHLP